MGCEKIAAPREKITRMVWARGSFRAEVNPVGWEVSTLVVRAGMRVTLTGGTPRGGRPRIRGRRLCHTWSNIVSLSAMVAPSGATSRSWKQYISMPSFWQNSKWTCHEWDPNPIYHGHARLSRGGEHGVDHIVRLLQLAWGGTPPGSHRPVAARPPTCRLCPTVALACPPARKCLLHFRATYASSCTTHATQE